ncbi:MULTISPECIES: glycoside hydrolase family 127 protein [Clostridium]|uniref:glycoside hydrolase family 127 protein n=1 Tax=Clostridium TaxID=1485 RepID=UPI000CDA89B3|nr:MULTISPECIES: beta-L-arabinofuranosidase domain-containing protein [Clostridium]MBN7576800.1 glycoside hydrolase family 127 protein [Clostridium beijerinckii]MBN7581708.1 glycoside hydrolase family 127 protein [Clostridium beijerinckii]MBN7586557.1 glycoside hydrolase family 127 protein [Clostridium beijerinckii]MBO0522682.1 glycoside hydrolase family 127 protein [Clostridium beijerinckii]MZK51065.1 glycoside hydrolase family 127 protein [Clostridium beijerinckii]
MNSNTFSKPLQINHIIVKDNFWKKMMELARTHVIPYQWEALNDRIEGAEPSYCMQNFKIAAGMMEGEFKGFVFQDSDFAKWIEAVGYSLMWNKDEGLEKIADGAIDIVCAAQQPDGYLDTYYIINGLDKRWTNLRDNHELYCLGHLIEGAVAYYEATGKDKLLNAIVKYVDYVDTIFGPEDGKLHGYPGHEVIELALIKLYKIKKDKKYLNLAKYFIDERGKSPLYFEEEGKKYNNKFWWEDSYFKYQYYQAGKPVKEQEVAEGHAVRAVYLYSGMADVARETNDDELLEACKRLWSNMTKKQMYITGGIGSSQYGEAFTYNYDLPNDTIYAETCASIGLVFFARRMLEIEPKSQYADIMEKALYNGIISGMSIDGTKFFYVNPLEVVPEASEKDHLRAHVKVERQKWFGCACCPPNLARLLTSIGSYAYTLRDNTIFMHLYMGGEISANFAGKSVAFDIKTNYPWDEIIDINLNMKEEADFEFALRIPEWCRNYEIKVNEEKINFSIIDGYAYINRKWKDADKINILFKMPVEIVRANINVREDMGKVAVMRGPVVYCLEEEDNGPDLHRVYLNSNPKFTYEYDKHFLGGAIVLESDGLVVKEQDCDKDKLYVYDYKIEFNEKKLKWIPYYLWANRTPGEMIVWVRRCI